MRTRVIRWFLFCLFAAALTQPLAAGPVIIGGDDLDYHGNYNNGAGPNQKGWLYIEKAIRDMRRPGCITRGDGSIAVLGAPASTLHNGVNNFSGHAGAAIHYAANVAQGITVQYFDLGAGITSFFAGLGSTYNPSILYIPSSYAFGGITTAAELAALNANATAIKNFVNSGGGLMAHVDPNSSWLPTVLGTGFAFGSASCDSSGATLTPAGAAAFTGLSNSDIDSTAGPCHATFTSFGTLQPLAIDKNADVFIIGGGCSTAIGPKAEFTATTACVGQATVFTNTSTNASTYSWNFGDGTPVSTLQNPTHLYANPGTYSVTLSVNGGQSTVTHNVIVAPLPPQPVISGPATTCGSPQTYCVAAAPGVTYNWTVTGGTPSTSTGSCITIAWNATGPYSVIVEAVTPNGCRRRQQLNIKPCAAVSCCESNTLQVSLASFSPVGGGTYAITSTLTAPPAWSVVRVRAELVSTHLMYSPASCGTSGPASSYVTAVAPAAGLPITSMPFTFGREAVWEISGGGGISATALPLTFTAQFPTIPAGWFCTDFLSFCVRYEVTMLVPSGPTKVCRTCSIARCYGPFKRSKWMPVEEDVEIGVGRRFPLRVRADAQADPAERIAAPSGRLSVSIKRGTGDPRAQLGGVTTVAIRDGVAEFRDLVIDRPGRGYVLVISAEDGTELAETRPINVR